MGDSNVLENIIGYLTVHDMKQLRFSVADLINADMSHVKRKICAANPDAYFWHYQDLFGRLVNRYKMKLNVRGVIMNKLQDAEAGIMDNQMLINYHHMTLAEDLFSDPDYQYVPLPKRSKLIQNPINILCENTDHQWMGYVDHYPFIRTISYESTDVKIRHFMFNKLMDDTGLAWNVFKYLDVPDMSAMTLALFDNVTIPSGEILYKIEEDWFNYDTYLLGQKCYQFELVKKVDHICGLNKRGKLYMLLMNMKDQLYPYLNSVQYRGLSSANEELFEFHGMRDIYSDEPFPLSNEGRLFSTMMEIILTICTIDFLSV